MKRIFIIVGIVIFLWLAVFAVDCIAVAGFGCPPIFCVKNTDEARYCGLGYSYVVSPHPVSGKTEYCMYIFGNEVRSTFTNELVACSDDDTVLTLEKVRALAAEKGESLSWSDFEQYPHKDIGSGLCIYFYEVDVGYELLIGGLPSDKPMYIHLVSKENRENFIDIRTENIDDFVN